ncbi:MAG: hypothetical protein C0478_14630 [Planctomyces sp.]|nr:hypothetical protein [Planctomyces sp.]
MNGFVLRMLRAWNQPLTSNHRFSDVADRQHRPARLRKLIHNQSDLWRGILLKPSMGFRPGIENCPIRGSRNNLQSIHDVFENCWWRDRRIGEI